MLARSALAALCFTVALPALAAGEPVPPRPGDPAPAVRLMDQDDAPFSLADHRGKIVVLEWINPECPFVKRHYRTKTMKSLAEKWAAKGVVWVAIDSTAHTDRASSRAWRAEHSLPYPILDDRSGRIGKAFGAKTTPHMYVLDTQHRVAYAGAIDDDNSRDGAKGAAARNWVDGVLEDLTSGREPTVRETRPYGCSVKYAAGKS